MSREQDANFASSPDGINEAFHVPLSLKDRALCSTAEGITISDPSLPDNPLIYVNSGFERLTGYSASSVIGKNCRFLQGPETDPNTAERIRSAISRESEITVEILNYRKDGKTFWNRLSITPVRDKDGKTTHFIGVQSDVTARRMAEDHLRTSNQQLEAINTRMKTALDSAANIQKSLLPTEAPNTETIDFAWRLLPCDELAGDSLNVVRLDETHIGLYILDVSGHGVPAALRSVTLAYLLTPETSRSVILTASKRKNSRPTMTPPARVAEQLNRDFPFDDRSSQFFTMIYGILDTQTYEFRYVCAGHPYPLLVPQSGKPIFHETGQLPIGVLPNTKYHESNLQMNSGDCLILYSDGVTEAQNNSDQQFGAEGLVKTIDKCREKTTERKVDEVIEAVKIWRGSSKIEDDVSVLAVGISED
jgi:PAS domain S-box-containing protein